jgi:protoheme IX farnesyltransferase
MNLVETPLVAAPPLASPMRQARAVESFAIARTLADYAQLVKPRLTLMVLFTVAIGFLLGTVGTLDVALLLHTLFGTALVAAGASALNQWLERDSDGLMRRTQNRPLPAGRMTASTVLRFGVVLSCLGLVYLALVVQPLSAAVVAVTLASYVFAYTPLKRRTTFNTLIGAVPGALPPVIGWTAATGTIGVEASVLFLILFLWQFPHFWAIAWLYRADYARAGLQMVPVQDAEGGRLTGRLMAQSCLALLVVSLLPSAMGLAGPRYFFIALVLGVLFLATAVRFLAMPSQSRARQVLWASLAYLPLLLTALLLDGPYLIFA